MEQKQQLQGSEIYEVYSYSIQEHDTAHTPSVMENGWIF
jgi:hypothetical protein